MLKKSTFVFVSFLILIHRLVQKLGDNGKKLEIFQTKILEQLMTIKTREHDYNIILDMISQDNTTMDKWKS